ncbi:AAEL005331-PA [Aedes aegypti]|uniref:AAEL005331-PA n=1 Tax=Aedes aegypti TaxID=7159 RepID=Q17AC9_AEDAE|nr:AAEL005331-PA [Aedes aegypti]
MLKALQSSLIVPRNIHPLTIIPSPYHILTRCIDSALFVHGQLQSQFKFERFVFLTQSVHNLPTPQPGHKLVQQNRFQILAELAVHRQFLQPPIPLSHVFVRFLAAVVKVRSLPEDGHLWGVLFPQEGAQLIEGLILGQHRMAQISQGFVRFTTDDTDQQGYPFRFGDIIHLEKLFQPLLVHVPVIDRTVELRNGTDQILSSHCDTRVCFFLSSTKLQLID